MHLVLKLGSSLYGLLPRIWMLRYPGHELELAAPLRCAYAVWVSHAMSTAIHDRILGINHFVQASHVIFM